MTDLEFYHLELAKWLPYDTYNNFEKSPKGFFRHMSSLLYDHWDTGELIDEDTERVTLFMLDQLELDPNWLESDEAQARV